MISAGFSISNLGMVWPHVKVKIEDPETGNLCGPNEEGEICAKTPYMMLQYLNKPKAGIYSCLLFTSISLLNSHG